MSKIKEYDPIFDSKTLQYSQDDVDAMLEEHAREEVWNMREAGVKAMHKVVSDRFGEPMDGGFAMAIEGAIYRATVIKRDN